MWLMLTFITPYRSKYDLDMLTCANLPLGLLIHDSHFISGGISSAHIGCWRRNGRLWLYYGRVKEGWFYVSRSERRTKSQYED